MRKIHFIGIGGIGTSALAQYYLSQGIEVSGSDANASEITNFLSKQGIEVFIGHNAQYVQGADLIIHTAAVKRGNVEYDEARKSHIPTKLYAEAVGELTKKFFTIAISGSHGKSTTTAMVAKILIDTGLDPTVIIGTKMQELDGNNFRAGNSKYLILEADEYNKHFHYYYPKIAVVNNIDKEHLDIYGDLEGVKQSFLRFMDNLDSQGTLIANGQDKSVNELVKVYNKKSRKIIVFNQNQIMRHKLSVFGQHNQSNAEAAFQVGVELGIDESKIHRSLLNFKGTWRRLEEILEGVYSDYAHHPTEIRASLKALRQANPTKRILCVFQPHQRDRLTRLFDEFIRSFENADKTIIIPLYKVAGRDEGEGKDSQDLVKAINKPSVYFSENFDTAYKTVSRYFDDNHVVVFMGAGDIDEKIRRKLE